MHARHDLRVDITGVSGIEGPLQAAVTAHLPAEVGEATTAVFAFPGGGYARGYYDLDHELLPGPTQAEHHVAAGLAVFACDHLGVGDSSLPEAPERLSFDVLAEANHRTVTAVLAGLRSGTLVDGLPPFTPARVVGMGQSMGGCLGIIQQADHRSFEAFAVLGFSGSHTTVPAPPDPALSPLRWAFHWDEEPEALVDADLSGAPQPWRSPTMPPSVPTMVNPGIIADPSSRIDVPLFLGAGERDTVPDLWSEPAAFRSCRDLTLFLLPRSAHMHNFAPTRVALWERLERWIASLA